MGNQPGSVKRPNAIAVIRKNRAAVVTQSPMIIPFYKLFVHGPKAPGIQPQGNWLSRR